MSVGAWSLRSILADPQFRVALGAAVPLWVAWLALTGHPPDWDWPLREPARFAALVFLYPVAEEMVFRGALQGWLLGRPVGQRRLAGITGANWLTSLVFTGLHFFEHPPLAAASVMVPSLVFGHFRDRHASLASPIMLHVFYNGGYFWLFG